MIPLLRNYRNPHCGLGAIYWRQMKNNIESALLPSRCVGPGIALGGARMALQTKDLNLAIPHRLAPEHFEDRHGFKIAGFAAMHMLDGFDERRKTGLVHAD